MISDNVLVEDMDVYSNGRAARLVTNCRCYKRMQLSYLTEAEPGRDKESLSND